MSSRNPLVVVLAVLLGPLRLRIVKAGEEESQTTALQKRESSQSRYCARCPMVDTRTKLMVLVHLQKR